MEIILFKKLKLNYKVNYYLLLKKRFLINLFCAKIDLIRKGVMPMGNLFTLDGVIFKTCTKIADIWLLNLMWVITSIPIFTIGASTTAMCYMSMKLAKGTEGYIISGFLKAFKSNFKKSTILYLIRVVVGGIIAGDFYFWSKLNSNLGTIMSVITICLGLFYLMILMYIFAVQARFENSIKDTIKSTIYISLQRFPYTLILVFLFVVVGYFFFNFIIVDFIMVVFGFGLVGFAFGIVYNMAFHKYIDDKKDTEEDNENEFEEDTEEDNEEVMNKVEE